MCFEILKMKNSLKIIIILCVFLLSGCERQQNCRGVRGGVKFNENIIERINATYCISSAAINTPVLILDSIELKKYFATDTNYCKQRIIEYDFSKYSLLIFATQGKRCGNGGIRFDLKGDGKDNYTLNIYKCGRQHCAIGPLSNADYIFKTKKLSNNNLKFRVYD